MKKPSDTKFNPIEEGRLFQITAPHFVAGLISNPKSGRVIRTAPIIKFMRENSYDMIRVEQYCRQKGWLVSSVEEFVDGALERNVTAA